MSISMPEREAIQDGAMAEGPTGNRPVVVIHQPIKSIPWSYEVERRIFAERGIDTVVPETHAENLKALPDADVVIACDSLTGDEIRSIKRPAGIVAYSVGMDYIDQRVAAERGIDRKSTRLNSSHVAIS